MGSGWWFPWLIRMKKRNEIEKEKYGNEHAEEQKGKLKIGSGSFKKMTKMEKAKTAREKGIAKKEEVKEEDALKTTTFSSCTLRPTGVFCHQDKSQLLLKTYMRNEYNSSAMDYTLGAEEFIVQHKSPTVSIKHPTLL